MKYWFVCLCSVSFLVWTWQEAAAQKTCRAYQKPVKTGVIEDTKVDESSGIAASRRYPGVWWTHNDSGGKARIYAFNEAGKDLGHFDLTGAKKNFDWEDMAAGPCPDGKFCLFVADVGDNNKLRSEIIVYRVQEPTLDLNKRTTGDTAPADKFILKYPDGAHDCEAIWVHPKTRDIVLVTKTAEEKSDIYRMPGNTPPGNATLEKVGTVTFERDLVTAADISPHGDQVVIRGYTYALIFSVGADGIPKDSTKLAKIDVGPTIQGEAVGYSADGTYLLATSERLPAPIYRVNCDPKGSEPTPEPASEPRPEPRSEPAKEKPTPTETPADAGSQDHTTPEQTTADKSPTTGACQCLNANVGLNGVGMWLGVLCLLGGMRRTRRTHR